MSEILEREETAALDEIIQCRGYQAVVAYLQTRLNDEAETAKHIHENYHEFRTYRKLADKIKRLILVFKEAEID